MKEKYRRSKGSHKDLARTIEIWPLSSGLSHRSLGFSWFLALNPRVKHQESWFFLVSGLRVEGRWQGV